MIDGVEYKHHRDDNSRSVVCGNITSVRFTNISRMLIFTGVHLEYDDMFFRFSRCDMEGESNLTMPFAVMSTKIFSYMEGNH